MASLTYRKPGFPQVDTKEIQGVSRNFSSVFKDLLIQCWAFKGTFRWLVINEAQIHFLTVSEE